MNPDEMQARLKQLAERFERAAPEHAELEAPPRPRTRRRWRQPQPASSRRRAPTLEELLLETFTPATAFAFIAERTVPPASDDGLALCELYPELAAAAPELVADMAAAFRNKQPHEYAAYFALVARHHGIDTAAQLELDGTERS